MFPDATYFVVLCYHGFRENEYVTYSIRYPLIHSKKYILDIVNLAGIRSYPGYSSRRVGGSSAIDLAP
jgi:hypothetical protein